MLRFFRYIRQTLLEQGKMKKYVLYALGEILLVMVGILLALQVSNWNEGRKLVQEELQLLSEIKTNLIQSRAEIDTTLTYNEEYLASYVRLLSHVENQSSYDTSMDKDFGAIRGWASPYLSYTAYETMKSKGSDLIKNKNLRARISSIYDRDFAYLVQDWDRAEWRDTEAVVIPYFTKHFKVFNTPTEIGSAKPNDYNTIMRDNEFSNVLHLLVYNRTWGNNMCERLIKQLTELISDIDEELVSRGFEEGVG